jgi:hypothetical protein
MTSRKTGARVAPRLLLAAALGCTLFVPLAAQADERDHCRNEIARDEHRLEWAYYQYGRYSYQYSQAYRRLQDARQDCWNVNHAWWDDRGRTWHEEHDWTDYRYDRW